MGISEAFYIPAALALIADYHTGETRSRAVSFHQMGIYCGVILGGFTGYAADHPSLGWRGAFGWSGLAGMALALPLVFLLKDRPRPASASSGNTAGLQTVRALLTNRSFLLLVVYFTLPALAGWVVRDWMPAILKSEFKIGQGKAGVALYAATEGKRSNRMRHDALFVAAKRARCSAMSAALAASISFQARRWSAVGVRLINPAWP
jgi:sugar phosphate permease